MDTGPRSNRPTPRTPAAIEAELRRRLRAELSDARASAEDGALDDATLAAIIARAIAAALSWHLEAPEHARGPQTSGSGWRSAPGPRARPRPQPQERDEPFGPRPRGSARGEGLGPRPPGWAEDFAQRPPDREGFGSRPRSTERGEGFGPRPRPARRSPSPAASFPRWRLRTASAPPTVSARQGSFQAFDPHIMRDQPVTCRSRACPAGTTA